MAAILLMTATVTPPAGATKLTRTDPAERLNDYREALRFYLRQLEQRHLDAVVFVDNSNSDIGVLRELAAQSPGADRVEFISFYGLQHPPEYGRAYGEMKLIEHAMAHSRTIEAATDRDYVWKVTGRYVLKNIVRTMRVRNGAQLICHCRNYPEKWADMFFMGWTKRGYTQILAAATDLLNEQVTGGSAETKFRAFLDLSPHARSIQKRLSATPELEGFRGYDGKRYESQLAKNLVRQLLDRLAPWIWI